MGQQSTQQQTPTVPSRASSVEQDLGQLYKDEDALRNWTKKNSDGTEVVDDVRAQAVKGNIRQLVALPAEWDMRLQTQFTPSAIQQFDGGKTYVVAKVASSKDSKPTAEVIIPFDRDASQKPSQIEFYTPHGFGAELAYNYRSFMAIYDLRKSPEITKQLTASLDAHQDKELFYAGKVAGTGETLIVTKAAPGVDAKDLHVFLAKGTTLRELAVTNASSGESGISCTITDGGKSKPLSIQVKEEKRYVALDGLRVGALDTSATSPSTTQPNTPAVSDTTLQIDRKEIFRLQSNNLETEAKRLEGWLQERIAKVGSGLDADLRPTVSVTLSKTGGEKLAVKVTFPGSNELNIAGDLSEDGKIVFRQTTDGGMAVSLQYGDKLTLGGSDKPSVDNFDVVFRDAKSSKVHIATTLLDPKTGVLQRPTSDGSRLEPAQRTEEATMLVTLDPAVPGSAAMRVGPDATAELRRMFGQLTSRQLSATLQEILHIRPEE